MSYTLDALLDQAIDNYPVTATLSPEIVAVLLYALGRIQNPLTWLDYREEPLDEITDADKDEIDELIAGANMAIITPEVGFIKPYITTSPPTNTIPCDGGTYNREDYPILYAVIDSVFIIDADTFTTPVFEGRVLVGAGTLGGSSYDLGDTGGTQEETLTIAQMPSHNHIADAPTVIDPTHVHAESGAFTVPVLEGAVPAVSAVAVPAVTAPALTGISVLAPNIHNEGGSGAHNNIQPYGVVKYCVQAR